MSHSHILHQYFPALLPSQMASFSQLSELYIYWNAKVNLISRRDIDHLYIHHVLHSLAIAKAITFCSGTQILDLGTGGGFPGIPLAIFFPAVHFHLVDSINKKNKIVQKLVAALGLRNVTVSCIRGEQIKGSYDFVVGRAVTSIGQFYSWSKDQITKSNHNSLHNGILYLTGKPVSHPPAMRMQAYAICEFFKEHYFQEKYLVHGYAI